MIDIIEQDFLKLTDGIFNIILMDRTTRKNICWATDQYISYGKEYYPQEPITKGLITGINTNVIKPRVSRSSDEQTLRTKIKAEVFTPSWVCNEQNNLIDEKWFGRKNVFNITNDKEWITVDKKIEFPKNVSWKKYVDAKRLEISCGEAPYLVSRYDTVTGNKIAVKDRIGLLDRKLRIVNENLDSENEWFIWVKRAYESIYGYEYQGDNLLIARENLLYTFIENMKYKFEKEPTSEQLNIIAKIISWNIWQMDGLSMCVPYSEKPRVHQQLTIFEVLEGEASSLTEPIPCKIFDWRSNHSLEFKSMLEGEI